MKKLIGIVALAARLLGEEHRQRGDDANQFFHNSKFEIKSTHN